jgi:succinyl-CoA synthetase beta subunit
VRFEGNNAARGSEILAASDVNILTAQGLVDAAEKVVAAAGAAA